MKNTKQLLLACVIASTSMAATADTGLYAGAGLSRLNLDYGDGDDDTSYTALEGKLGYKLNPYFAIEGQLGLGISGESTEEGDGTFTFQYDNDLNYYLNIYAKPQFAFSKVFSIYALLGLTFVDAEDQESFYELGERVESDTVDYSGNNFSYGIGANFRFTDQLSLDVEWKSLNTLDGDYQSSDGYTSEFETEDFQGFSLGLNFAF